MEITWTEEATLSFKKNILYLKEKWSLNEINEFKAKTKSLLGNLKDNPMMGYYDHDWGCNRILIVSQITLFYFVDRNKIVLISFWNNKRKPIKKLI